MNITVYDPKAIKNTKIIFGEKIKYASSISNSLKNSQCAIIMVHWKQFEKINNIFHTFNEKEVHNRL